MKKYKEKLLLLENISLNHDNYRLILQAERDLSEIFPGQFVHIKIEKAGILLRRPFSVFDVNKEKRTISLLIKILGKGSKVLTTCKPGEKIDIIYPLGKGFTLPDKKDKILLVGGGVGVAPILFLAKMAGIPSENVSVIIGAKDRGEHISVEDYKLFGNFYFATEDGSMGTKGFVTDVPEFVDHLSDYNKIYTCGPSPMMKAIVKEALKRNIFCEASLESKMACGIGICLCCVEKTTTGNRCVCTDGPVFNAKELIW